MAREVPILLLSLVAVVLGLVLAGFVALTLPLRDRPGAGVFHRAQQMIAGLFAGCVFMAIQNPQASYHRVRRAARP
jgi:hypothetical protein